MGGAAAGCLAMMISISTSGGMAGFGLAPGTTEVSVDALPEPLRAETCARLDATALAALAPAPARGADRITYHIVVTSDGGTTTRFDLPETALPAETLDVIDALMSQGR
jgi:hypothetical protein